MKPLIALIVVFVISLGFTWIVIGEFNYSLAGAAGMCAMLLLTAFGHFRFRKGMQAMLPDVIPYRSAIIVLTGIIEIAAAIGLLIPQLKLLTGWLLIIFFALILPANISAAIRRIDYQKGTADGPGPAYLWFRIPLQLFFIGWVYFFVIYLKK